MEKLVDYVVEVSNIIQANFNCMEVLFIAAEGVALANSGISVTD